eukprot:gene28269-35105_t
MKAPTLGRVAGYAKENSLTKVRHAIKHNNIQDGYDIQGASKVIANIVDSHEMTLQEERFTEPDRFSVSTKGSVTHSIQEPRRMSTMREDIPQVTAKEIQVRQLDRNITHLRATKEYGSSRSPQGSPKAGNNAKMSPRSVSPTGSEHGGGGYTRNNGGAGDYDGGSLAGSITNSHGGGGVMLPENSLSLLNSCITRIMTANNHPIYSARAEPITNYFSALDILTSNSTSYDNRNRIDEVIAATLNEIAASAAMLADACVMTPKQFWKVSDLFCSTLINAPFESAAFGAAVNSFEALGLNVVQRDAHSSLSLFCDFAMFKLSNTLVSNPRKRLGILKLLHAFAPNTANAHIQCIKRLQAIVSVQNTDLAPFIHCLTILATNETLVIDDMLLDLYAYYSTIGLSMQSPKIRSCAISILNSLLPQGELIIAQQLPLLEKFATPSECRSIDGLFAELVSRLERQDDRNYLLSLERFQNNSADSSSFRTINAPTTTSIPYLIRPVAVNWNPLDAALSIESVVSNATTEVERLRPVEVQILYAALLSKVVQGIFKLLYVEKASENQQTCQSVFELFLRDVFSAGAPFNSVVYSVLQGINKNSPAVFGNGVGLQKMLKEFSSQMR